MQRFLKKKSGLIPLSHKRCTGNGGVGYATAAVSDLIAQRGQKRFGLVHLMNLVRDAEDVKNVTNMIQSNQDKFFKHTDRIIKSYARACIRAKVPEDFLNLIQANKQLRRGLHECPDAIRSIMNQHWKAQAYEKVVEMLPYLVETEEKIPRKTYEILYQSYKKLDRKEDAVKILEESSVHFVALKQQKILLNHYASKEDHQAVLDTFQQLRRFDEVFSKRDLVDVASTYEKMGNPQQVVNIVQEFEGLGVEAPKKLQATLVRSLLAVKKSDEAFNVVKKACNHKKINRMALDVMINHFETHGDPGKMSELQKLIKVSGLEA